MKVSTSEPFEIVYSIYLHEYLGYLMESFAVQKDSAGRLTLRHQNISAKNAKEFKDAIDETDYKLIALIDEIQQDTIVKKFYNKKVATADFFLKTYHKEKGDKLVQQAIADYVDRKKVAILSLMTYKPFFIMGDDGEPTWQKVEPEKEFASVLFHFVKNEDNTHYFPTIRHNQEKVEFQYRNSIILSNKPAYLIANGKMYHFEKEVDGNKIKPFLNKKFIVIPKKVEEQYYMNFVAPLISHYNVRSQGFEINTERYEAVPTLTISELASSANNLSLFDEADNKAAIETKIVFELSFKYGNYVFTKMITDTPVTVKMEKNDENYIFHRIQRSELWEKKIVKSLINRGLELKHGKFVAEKSRAFSWITTNVGELKESGFHISQQVAGDKKYFLGQSSIDIRVEEKIDWFDVHAIITFGEYKVPFNEIRALIKKDKNEFTLPNGEIAVIPSHWFETYSELLNFSHETEDGELRLKKHHLSVVEELKNSNLAKVTINEKLQNLRDFEQIEDYDLPKGFKGELRPYQKAGYNWMQFLKEYNFGGCLADDMGLGKTVQTLCLLLDQKEKEKGLANLLILPTSLVYNWEVEARKFTPDLKILIYTGTSREKDVTKFSEYDLVITTYGIVRIDIELLQAYFFNYIILDESQAIKNPSSTIAKSVQFLKSKHKLVLTGTPVENSTLDLWSQMNFINPGLLGTESFFKKNYQLLIEKKKNEQKTKKLYSLVKPFIMRRQKSQVLTELPEKIEHIQYCKMTTEQEKVYEETKSYYREQLIDSKTKKKEGKSNNAIVLLQGLTKLRQIANHPFMADAEYEGASGKLEDILEMYRSAIEHGHKILIFSQFTKHLAIIRKELDKEEVPYAYLDGRTKDRQKQVDHFQKNEGISLFLISLKAGGLGLNLTKADYVFILDPWWNPAAEAQAVDRAYRMGQKNKVFTYKFITKNTVEEKILQLQQNKRQLASDLISVEESFVKSLSTEDIAELLA
ncbi:MAG: DEAD/DEAH box helicase [Cyclobacteriaceae bacterium]